MTKIIECDAEKCVYNKDKKCHTYGINVGDDLPICDTFMKGIEKAGASSRTIGGIGSCKVKGCTYNEGLECHAGGVHMHKTRGHVDCKTYQEK
ncbi:MAG: DUF1540 domain-containing protein [Cetobacterium sp.]